MRVTTAVFFILLSLAVLVLAAPFAGAIVPGNTTPGSLPGTGPDLNVTTGSSANHTLPAQYAIKLAPIRLEVRISETALPAAKGEMAAGPRSIGFSFEPVTLVVLVLVAAAVSTGTWYIIRRKPGENDENE